VALQIARNGEVDTRRIEAFFLGQNGVVDANVWTAKGSVLARVTVAEDVCCGETDLRSACEAALGPGLTPNLIMLERALRRAA
jgi:hypothetical protein